MNTPGGEGGRGTSRHAGEEGGVGNFLGLLLVLAPLVQFERYDKYHFPQHRVVAIYVAIGGAASATRVGCGEYRDQQ